MQGQEAGGEMDIQGFEAALPEVFGGDPYTGEVQDDRFGAVVDRVDGMSTEHSLALLNCAVSFLDDDEWYLEVGSYRGRSLVGAALGHDHDRFLAVENFREFGVDPDLTHAQVMRTLEAWDMTDRVRFVRGEAFRLLPGETVPGPVGVYFYDGAHSRLAQYLGLGLVEPHLAEHAVVIVDDASWPQVASSTASYMSKHRGYELVFDLRAERDYDPRWCNGVKVFSWRRPPGWRPRRDLDLAWRRAAHLYLHEPALHFAWRTLPRYPRLSAALKRVYLHGGSRVSP